MNLFRNGRRPEGERAPILARTPNVVASTGRSQTLRLYEPIDSWGGEWGVSAQEFVSVIDSLPEQTEEIRLLINSPGGEVWEGLAILNALRAHKARVVAVVEGIAASSASFIACGVDELVMMKNSELFIHNAWGPAIGDAEVLQKLAADLEHVPALYNGGLAFVSLRGEQPIAVWAIDIGPDGIRGFYNVMNPAKLSRIAAASGHS